MTAPLIGGGAITPSAPPHDDDHDTGSSGFLPYRPPPPPLLPEAHPVATVVTTQPPGATEEGAHPVYVDMPARRRAEATAAERVREERARAAMAEQEVSCETRSLDHGIGRSTELTLSSQHLRWTAGGVSECVGSCDAAACRFCGRLDG